MAKSFLDLPVPVGDGTGAAVDTSDLAARKTITVAGTISSVACTIEVSQDNSTWAPLYTFTVVGKRSFTVAAGWMRVRISGSVGVAAFSLNVDVGADEVSGNFSAVNVPAADGVGTALDVSTFGDFMTVVVAGTYTGSIIIEISQDGTDWSPMMGFSGLGLQSRLVSAYRLRVRRTGTDPALPGTPTVSVGAVDVLSSGAGGGNPVLVFRPGGVQVDNVYTVWSNLVAARALIEGPVDIFFDDSIVSPCVIPAGGPYDVSDTVWRGKADSGVATTVTIADGASFTGIPAFTLLTILNQSTTSPWTLANGDRITLYDFCDLGCDAGAAPAFDGSLLGAGEYAVLDLYNYASIGQYNPNVTVIDMSAAVADFLFVVIGERSICGNNTVDCNAAGTVQFLVNAPSGFLLEQNGALGTVQYLSRSVGQYRMNPEPGVAPATADTGNQIPSVYIRLNATAGSFTQAMPEIAHVGVSTELNWGRRVIVQETSGVNGITLDGYNAETIDGAATFFLPPGGCMAFISDGVSNWASYAINPQTLLNRHNTFTRAQGTAKVTLADAATIATDASLGNVFEVTLGGNRALGLPTNLVSGFTYMWIIKQDGGAPRTLTYNAIFKFPGAVTPVLSTGNNDVDVITAVYDGTNLLCVFQADFS